MGRVQQNPISVWTMDHVLFGVRLKFTRGVSTCTLLVPINVGVKMQAILWCAWPPPGRSSTLKIVCGSNIDDIRGNTTLVANCLYF